MKVKVMKTNPEAKLPKFAFDDDAGADIYSVEPDFVLEAGDYAAIDTGLAIETPSGYETQVRPKSGLALNRGITILNTPGTIDTQYRGKLLVILINHNKHGVRINKGEKIAQICVRPIPKIEFIEVNELSNTEREEGGFGSTDIN